MESRGVILAYARLKQETRTSEISKAKRRNELKSLTACCPKNLGCLKHELSTALCGVIEIYLKDGKGSSLNGGDRVNMSYYGLYNLICSLDGG